MIGMDSRSISGLFWVWYKFQDELWCGFGIYSRTGMEFRISSKNKMISESVSRLVVISYRKGFRLGAVSGSVWNGYQIHGQYGFGRLLLSSESLSLIEGSLVVLRIAHETTVSI